MQKWLFAALLSAAALLPTAANATGTVYVIRHLEKAAGDNPPLTTVGAARAEQLAQVLAGAGIRAIFATPTRRARETAMPLATKLGIPISDYDPRDVQALAAAVAAANGPVLIVGHSNTVASLVAKFGGDKPAELTEQDYGTLFVVHPGTNEVHRIQLS